MTKENKSTSIISPESIIFFLHDVEIAKRLIEIPEYFYQQPTPEQEEKFEEDYLVLWEKVAEKEGISVPKTINAFFGRVEFIKDAVHFKDLLGRYNSPGYEHRQVHFLEKAALPKAREEAFEKLNSLSPKEVKKLQAKTANTPLHVIDLPTGNLFPFPSYK